MSDTRWRVRRTTWDDGAAHHHHQFVGEYGTTETREGTFPRHSIYGDTIAEVIDAIAFHEGEQP